MCIDKIVDMLQNSYVTEGVVCETYEKSVEEGRLENYPNKFPKSIKTHFDVDWEKDDGIVAMGYKPLFPYVVMFLGVEESKERYKLYVYCEEGSVAIEEIRLARKGAMVLPHEIAKRCKDVRDSRQEHVTESIWYTGKNPKYGVREFFTS